MGSSSVQIKKYKNEHQFERDANRMVRDGYRIEGQSTRTKNWRLLTGPFTNKGIITVTWIRDRPAVSQPAVQRAAAPAAAPQLSPDGRYWWDGRTWVPVPPAPGIEESSPAVAAATLPPREDIPAKLQQLGELRDAGIVSSEEFESKKADLLSRL